MSSPWAEPACRFHCTVQVRSTAKESVNVFATERDPYIPFRSHPSRIGHRAFSSG